MNRDYSNLSFSQFVEIIESYHKKLNYIKKVLSGQNNNTYNEKIEIFSKNIFKNGSEEKTTLSFLLLCFSMLISIVYFSNNDIKINNYFDFIFLSFINILIFIYIIINSIKSSIFVNKIARILYNNETRWREKEGLIRKLLNNKDTLNIQVHEFNIDFSKISFYLNEANVYNEYLFTKKEKDLKLEKEIIIKNLNELDKIFNEKFYEFKKNIKKDIECQ